jgi:hypothetical protein
MERYQSRGIKPEWDYFWIYQEAIAEQSPTIDDIECEYADRLMGNPKPTVSLGLDPGIKKYVEGLQDSGIETFESCEGGKGHAYPEPAVRFHGGSEAGWRALSVCLKLGFPMSCLRRVWYVLETNEPTGPYWEITFRRPC